MSNARDLAVLRRLLFAHLPGEAFERVNMTAVGKSVTRLSAAGWTPEDIASQVLGDYGDGDPAALVVARVARLDGPPPREDVTPQPVHITAIVREREVARAAAQGVNAHAWVERIKAAAAEARAEQRQAQAERQADAS